MFNPTGTVDEGLRHDVYKGVTDLSQLKEVVLDPLQRPFAKTFPDCSRSMHVHVLVFILRAAVHISDGETSEIDVSKCAVVNRDGDRFSYDASRHAADSGSEPYDDPDQTEKSVASDAPRAHAVVMTTAMLCGGRRSLVMDGRMDAWMDRCGQSAAAAGLGLHDIIGAFSVVVASRRAGFARLRMLATFAWMAMPIDANHGLDVHACVHARVPMRRRAAPRRSVRCRCRCRTLPCRAVPCRAMPCPLRCAAIPCLALPMPYRASCGAVRSCAQ